VLQQPSQPNRPAGFTLAWARLAILLLCALMAQAQAQGTWDNCQRHAGQVYQDFPPTPVQMGNDAVIGDVIGPWITASAARANQARAERPCRSRFKATLRIPS